MDINQLIPLITVLVTLICGVISKRITWFNNKLIPIQNLAIGLIIATVDFIITKDFSAAISVSGLLAGGIYDIASNLGKLAEEE